MVDRAIAILAVAAAVVLGSAVIPNRHRRWRPFGYFAGVALLIAAVVALFLPAESQTGVTIKGDQNNCLVGGSGNTVTCLSAPSTSNTSDGALLEITPQLPKLNKGNYDFRMNIANVGKSSVGNYVVQFEQELDASPYSPEYANGIMAKILAILNKFPVETLFDDSGTIPPGRVLQLWQPKMIIDEPKYNQIMSGTQILYEGAGIIYTDEFSVQHKKLYYAERCVYWSNDNKAFADCVAHNFSKSHWPPSFR
jgi:hypothetical protein